MGKQKDNHIGFLITGSNMTFLFLLLVAFLAFAKCNDFEMYVINGLKDWGVEFQTSSFDSGSKYTFQWIAKPGACKKTKL